MSKTNLITGAGSGFGEGAAIGMAKNGHTVIATAQISPQVAALRRRVDELGLQNLRVEKLDLLDPHDVASAQTWDIDVLFNNAGVGEAGPVSVIPIDLLTDSAPWTIVGHSVVSKTYDGREAFMRDVIRPFNARMRDPLKPVIRRVYADGDSVIIFFDAHGTARDGKPYANTYAWFFDMRDGKVVKAVASFDSVEFNEFWRRVTPAPAK